MNKETGAEIQKLKAECFDMIKEVTTLQMKIQKISETQNIKVKRITELEKTQNA